VHHFFKWLGFYPRYIPQSPERPYRALNNTVALLSPPLAVSGRLGQPSLGLTTHQAFPSNLAHGGQHLLVELYDCNANILNNVEKITEAMTQAAVLSGVSVLHSNFHHFSPYGVSGLVLVPHAHFAIHTWPEYCYAAVDIFVNHPQVEADHVPATINPHEGLQHLKASFGCQTVAYTPLTRGEATQLTPSFTPDQANTTDADLIVNQ
jgi:S-adenosylmethionine decarboxylase proenzyme